MFQGRPDDSPPPLWADVAWRLWRRQHLTFKQIEYFLALEGWEPSPGEIAAVVLDRAGGELGS